MTSNATRRKRRRRVAVSAVIVVLLVVLGVVALSRQQAVSETRRAEAAKLLALGQLRLEDYPTATLAYAVASLEFADTAEARRLALRALWEGPTAFVVADLPSRRAEFSPAGARLNFSLQDPTRNQLGIVAKDGPITMYDRVYESDRVYTASNAGGTVLYTQPELESEAGQRVVLRSLPGGRDLNDVWFDPPAFVNQRVIGWNRDRFLALVSEGDLDTIHAFNFDGTDERLGTVDGQSDGWWVRPAMDLRTGRWVATVEGNKVVVIGVRGHGLSAPRILGRHEGTGHCVAFDPEGRLLATGSSDGLIKVWDPDGASPPVVIQGPKNVNKVGLFGVEPGLAVRTEGDGVRRIWVYSLAGGDPRLLRIIDAGQAGDYGLKQDWGWDQPCRRLARNGPDQWTRVWSLSAPADAEPMVLRRGDIGTDWDLSFHPSGSWMATADTSSLMMWPSSRPYPWTIRAHEKPVWSVSFGPDGRWLASGGLDRIVRLTPLTGEVPAAGRMMDGFPQTVRVIKASPDGTRLFVGCDARGVTVVPLDGEPPFRLNQEQSDFELGISRDGKVMAVVGLAGVIRLWRTDTREETAVLDSGLDPGSLRMLDDGRILVTGLSSGLWALDPTSGESQLLFEGICVSFAATADGRRVALVDLSEASFGASGRLVFLDLDAGTTTHLASHGDQVWWVAMDAAGTTVVTGDKEGVLRVGSTSGGEPHLLYGHEGRIWSVDIDPLGLWIASGGEDSTVRIWPMPDLSKPPLHTLPHGELLAKLNTLTNLRMVRDDTSPTGWTLTHDPFPGWETVPTW